MAESNRKYFTKEQQELIVKLYETLSVENIARHLCKSGFKVSGHRVKTELVALGIKIHPRTRLTEQRLKFHGNQPSAYKWE